MTGRSKSTTSGAFEYTGSPLILEFNVITYVPLFGKVYGKVISLNSYSLNGKVFTISPVSFCLMLRDANIMLIFFPSSSRTLRLICVELSPTNGVRGKGWNTTYSSPQSCSEELGHRKSVHLLSGCARQCVLPHRSSLRLIQK